MISFDPALLDSKDTLHAVIFEDTVELVVQRRERQMLYASWHGVVRDSAESYFMFVKRGEDLSGVLGFQGRDYSLKPCGNAYGLAEINHDELPMEGSEEVPNPAYEALAGCGSSTLMPNFQIELMVLYTLQARDAAALNAGVKLEDTVGVRLAIEAEIAQAVEVANMAFASSDLSIRLQLAYVGLVGNDTTWEIDGSAKRILNRLSRDQRARKLRDLYSADLVSIFVEDISECGLANYYQSTSYVSAGDAFSVVKMSCASNQFTLAHEIGHNLGLRHDCNVDQTNTEGHGYLYRNKYLRWVQTLMATQENYHRLPYFSDPSAGRGRLDGSCKANDVAVLRTTIEHVVNYRCAGVVDDVWINDNFGDLGEEPNQTAGGNQLMQSPNVWVRHKPDPYLTHMYCHQNPLLGDNYLYVKLRNGSSKPQKGMLKAYGKAASLFWGFPREALFQMTHDTVVLPPQSTIVLEMKFRVGLDLRHYSYAVEWMAQNDPMSNPGCNNLYECVSSNNNIAARCLASIYLDHENTGQQMQRAYKSQQAPAVERTHETACVQFQPLEKNFIRVELEPREGIGDFVQAGGKLSLYFPEPGEPFDRSDSVAGTDRIIAVEKDTEIGMPDFLKKGPEAAPADVWLMFDATRVHTPGKYNVHLYQYGATKIFGSYTYQIIVGDKPHQLLPE